MAMNVPMGGFGFPFPPGIPSYPGPVALNSMPGLQKNPVTDGTYAHGLSEVPYINALFEDENNLQSFIYGLNNPPLGFPQTGPTFMQGGFTPPMPLPPGAPGGTEGTGGNGATGGEGGTTGGNGATGGHGATGGESATGGNGPVGGNLNHQA